MLIFVQISNFKIKLIDNTFPVKGTPIKTNNEASNKKECIWMLCFAMVEAGDCPAFSAWCKRLQYIRIKDIYSFNKYWSKQEEEIQYNSSYCSIYLIISKLLWKLPNVCIIMLTGCHKYVAHLKLVTKSTATAYRKEYNMWSF